MLIMLVAADHIPTAAADSGPPYLVATNPLLPGVADPDVIRYEDSEQGTVYVLTHTVANGQDFRKRRNEGSDEDRWLQLTCGTLLCDCV
jgi:hypothetical protein